MPMNYFEPAHTAERYAKGRPDFHDNTIKRISAFLQLKGKVGRALDIACGTGLSTKALLRIAEQVYGTDSSVAMLKHAESKQEISYQLAAATEQPFPDQQFDLITVCSGVHWFDIDAFLKEAHRLLKHEAWLVLYDNFFLSQMKDVPAFDTWFAGTYLKKFPSPARHNHYDWSDENLGRRGFIPHATESFQNGVVFTQASLALYFTTQSNIAHAVTHEGGNYAAIEHWLHTELNPFFDDNHEPRTLYFGNTVQYLQRLT